MSDAPKGVVAIVGCGLGLGGAVAAKFASEGYSVAAMARSQQSLDYVKELLEKAGAGAAHGYYTMDATKKEDVDAAFAKAVSELGTVTVMVYNISDSPKTLMTKVLAIDPAEYVAGFSRNALGALMCTQAVLPGMLESAGKVLTGACKGVPKKGTLMYTSASAAFRSTATTAMLSAGKMALRGLSQSVAKEYGKQGIHAVHLRMDCTYESARNQQVFEANNMGEYFTKQSEANKLASIDALAETYFALHMQSPMAWSNEVDLRPYTEDWTY